jgi:hypothetical protein
MNDKPFAIIGGITFKNKTAVRKHNSVLIQSNELGHTFTGDDARFLHGLLERHRETAQGGTTFADPAVSEDFRQFHRERATLRVIHKTLNLSGGNWRLRDTETAANPD